MINDQLSNKIKLAGLLCTIMVIYRHALNHQAFFGKWKGNSIIGFIEGGCSTATEIAVPFFFLISGFFFFKNSYYGMSYVKVIKKKIKTLFIPFLFWNLVGLTILVSTNYFIPQENLIKYIGVLLNSEWNGSLWYVRNLMLLMLLYPLYGWIFLANQWWIYTLCIVISYGFWIPVDCALFSTEGILFFLIGGIFQKYNIISKETPLLKYIWILVLGWLCISFFRPYWGLYMNRLNTLLGIIVFWHLLDMIKGRYRDLLLSLSGFSFFIYVNHLYIIKGMKVWLAQRFFGNDAIALFAYLILPIITIIIILIMGRIWIKYSPRSFHFVTGGRG